MRTTQRSLGASRQEAHRCVAPMCSSTLPNCTGPCSMPSPSQPALPSASCSAAPAMKCSQARAPRAWCLRAAAVAKPDESQQPWSFGFQVNERYLLWDDAAAGQLVKMVVAQKMQLTTEDVEVRLQELALVIPDLLGKLERMKPDILQRMLQDVPELTVRLLNLRDQLPGVNVSSLVARWPYIVLDYDAPAFNARLEHMRTHLPGVEVEQLIDAEPMLLKADMPGVLQNARRLLPKADPVGVIVSHPHMVLDMASAGMLSALDVEGVPPKPSS